MNGQKVLDDDFDYTEFIFVVFYTEPFFAFGYTWCAGRGS